MKFILFDIDGTLMSSGGAGTRSLNLAFEEIFSIPHAFNGMSMAGKTDIQIMKEGLRKHSLDSGDGVIPSICNSYIRHLQVEIKNPKKHLKPGIIETLMLMSNMENVYLGLLTGNIETGARIKLGAFDLNRYFPVGAFGSDHEDRNLLPPVAVEKFRCLYNKDIAFRDCIVIGDTPRDVECAKIYGAYSVAVATGPYSFDSLVRSGAELVLEDMLNIDAVLHKTIYSH